MSGDGILARMERFSVVPSVRHGEVDRDGKSIIHDGDTHEDIEVFEGPGALKRAAARYLEIIENGPDAAPSGGAS